MRFSLPIVSQSCDLYSSESEVSETSSSNYSGSERPEKISNLRDYLISFQKFLLSVESITTIMDCFFSFRG